MTAASQREQISAYIDGELEEKDRDAFERALVADARLRTEVKELELLRQSIRDGSERASAELPQARFEQVWDAVDAAIDRDKRLRQSVSEDGTSNRWFASTLEWLTQRPLASVAAGVAALLVVYVGVRGVDNDPSGQNKPPMTASKDQSPLLMEPSVTLPKPASDARQDAAGQQTPEQIDGIDGIDGIKVAMDTPLPTASDSNEAEILKIEFGGRSGKITTIEGRKGTTTVIWVTEDETPASSERAL